MFAKRETDFCKGIAIVMMLFHHLFNDYEEYAGFAVSYWPLTGERITFLALLCRLCVAVFVILSGYGLASTWHRKFDGAQECSAEEIGSFVWRRLWKLMTSYWFVFLIVLLCQPLGRTIFDAYGRSPKAIIAYFAADAAGLSFLFKTPTLNPTWWYMTLAIAFIILLPFVMCAVRKMGAVLTAALVLLFPYCMRIYSDFTFYLPALLFGILCCETNLMGRLDALQEKRRILVPAAETALLFLLLYFRTDYNMGGFVDGLWALSLMAFVHSFLAKLPVISRAAEFLGRHSANIFLLHNPLYSFYFTWFFYSFRHWAVILLALTLVSLLCSVLIEWLKRVSHYTAVMEKAGRILRWR